MPQKKEQYTVLVSEKDKEYMHAIIKQNDIFQLDEGDIDEFFHKMVVSYRRKNKIKEEETAAEKFMRMCVQEIMAMFALNNPSFVWGHKGHRNACESMLKHCARQGKDFADLRKLVDYMLKKQGQDFVPEISTPTEMWKKWTKCMNFIAKQKRKIKPPKPPELPERPEYKRFTPPS